MKIKIMLLAISVALSSFSSKIPEPEKLHPEFYTIQFSLAELPTDFEMYKKSSPHEQPTIERVENSGANFTTLTTIYTALNKEFSCDTGDVKGKLDSESETIDILKLKIPDYEITDPFTIEAKSTGWSTFFLGGKIVEGKEKKYCLLVKTYAPKK
ncbi:hypothetical protein EGM51_09775 [Verrucomicrobia bacterium S94]|nr:hypothetical protein EGM51_09775 [Verrucomicrobia bacterium S94]